MTSGSFKTFPTSSIWVNRDKRQRRELRDIESLADSISRIGLIHPPVIKRDGELVVGERRLTAIQSLGWTDIPIQFIDELSTDELRKVELEENVRRVDLTWQEQCNAVAEYHALRADEEGWTQSKTAQALGFSPAAITSFLNVAKELNNGNEMVKAAPKLSTARNITERKISREKAAIVASIAEPDGRASPLLNADFHEWTKAYDGEPFNLIHCDFPYGINFHSADQASSEFASYEDSADTYWELLETLKGAMDNVVGESAHLLFWFSMNFYEATKLALSEMGWTVNPFPLIWFKSDNASVLPDSNRGPRRGYETAFFASRGDHKIVQAVNNCFAHPGWGKTLHKSEKPTAMLQHFMRMVCDGYSSVLDPTCGSGNALKAARSCGAVRVLGLERDTEIFNIAKEHYFDD